MLDLSLIRSLGRPEDTGLDKEVRRPHFWLSLTRSLLVDDRKGCTGERGTHCQVVSSSSQKASIRIY